MSAILSACGSYRYRLERSIGLFGPVAAVIMVNPSTADARTDDATIRRLIGFGKRLGWSKVIVGNIFAYRAKDIRQLGRVIDPVGPANMDHLRSILHDADIAVAAWGPLAKLPKALRHQWESICSIAEEAGTKLNCLGFAADGHPRHPLMLSYQSNLTGWVAPRDLAR